MIKNICFMLCFFLPLQVLAQVPIDKGEEAPEDGVFLSKEEAAKVIAEREIFSEKLKLELNEQKEELKIVCEGEKKIKDLYLDAEKEKNSVLLDLKQKQIENLVFFLGDQPEVRDEVIIALQNNEMDNSKILIPQYRYKLGFPVLVPRPFWSKLELLTQDDPGEFEISAYKDFDLIDYFVSSEVKIEKLNFKIISAGFDPISKLSDIPNNPKQRYEVMTKDMPEGGSLSLDMMYRTCGTQLNVDYISEEDFTKKFKLSNYLTPINIALFANSSVIEKKNSGYFSYRSHTWQQTSRGGLPEFFLEDFNFEKYATQ